MSSTPPAPLTAAPTVETREAVLHAAREVFAARGVRSATIREICQRAGANVAAVNYHFGDKESLYREVLRFAHAQEQTMNPPEYGVPRLAPPQIRLHAFVAGFLRHVLDHGPYAWHGKLVAMEMIEPTAALDTLVDVTIRPMADLVRGIVRGILGDDADPGTVRLCGSSIVSQCLFYHHCRSVVTRLFPEQGFGPEGLAELADHITRFSLAGLQQYVPDPAARGTQQHVRAAKASRSRPRSATLKRVTP